jgi:hypothetical protein
MSAFAQALDTYLSLCRAKLLPSLDGQPWPETAVNPAPTFRAIFERAERTAEFQNAAKEFEGLASCGQEVGLVFRGFGRWHLSAFLWNFRIYDELIRGQNVDANSIQKAMVEELSRTDVNFTHAAFLEGFACDGPAVETKDFAIRHLTDTELREAFIGRCRLDQYAEDEEVRQALAREWFIVVQEQTMPLQDRLFMRGGIGLHRPVLGIESPFRKINLALNLFKTSPGPAIIRQTFHWNSSLFDRSVYHYPCHGEDLYPSSWSEPDGPPVLRTYRLAPTGAEALPRFWDALQIQVLALAPFLPLYLHRAIDRFLRACGWNRPDWEFRQLLYVMALEALFSGERDEKVRPKFRDKQKKEKEVDVKSTVSICCASLVSPTQSAVGILRAWVFRTYEQRSRTAHGSTFEQQQFLAQPSCPDEHGEALAVCKSLGIETEDLREGPDIELAVLHNIVRLALLMFMARVARLLIAGEPAEIVRKLSRQCDQPDLPCEERTELQNRLGQLELEDKRKLIQSAYGCCWREGDRLQLRRSLDLLLSITV